MKNISPAKYIELINKEIKNMEGYKHGMEVYLVPSADNPSGYSCDEKWKLQGIQGLLAAASHKIDRL